MVARKFLEDLMSLVVEDFCECDIFIHRVIFFFMGYVGISQIREVFQEDLVDIMETKGRQVPVQFPVVHGFRLAGKIDLQDIKSFSDFGHFS